MAKTSKCGKGKTPKRRNAVDIWRPTLGAPAPVHRSGDASAYRIIINSLMFACALSRTISRPSETTFLRRSLDYRVSPQKNRVSFLLVSHEKKKRRRTWSAVIKDGTTSSLTTGQCQQIYPFHTHFYALWNVITKQVRGAGIRCVVNLLPQIILCE